MSVSESAGMLGVSEQRVRALIGAGVLPAVKLGRSWMLKEEDVLDRVAQKPKGGRPHEKEAIPTGEDDTGADDVRLASPEDLRRLYRECKRAFAFRPSAADIQAAKSAEEAAFYMAVADFFLKSRQAELVKAGVF